MKYHYIAISTRKKKLKTLLTSGTSVTRQIKLMEGFKMVIIKKATQAQTIAAIKSGDFSTVDTINRKAEKEAMEIFKAVAGGVIKLAYWDMPPVKRRDGKKSVMRYALHRSTKKENCLQLSCMELIGGEIIPTSDKQFKINDDYDRREFFRSIPSVTKMTLK
nr:MAG TPA: hypothetical protein [Caudoviricetes sp.]